MMRKKAFALLVSSVFVLNLISSSVGGTRLVVRAADEVTVEQEESGTSEEVVKDTLKPVLKGIKNKVVFVKSKVNYRKGVTAYDNIDGNITQNIKVNSSKVNLKKAGKYTVTYTVKDSAENMVTKKATIRVKADKAPVITGVKNRTIYVNGSISYKKGVKAKDDKDGVITKKIKVNSSKVKRGKPGKYVVVYSVKDSYGHKTVKQAVITVKRKQNSEPNGKVINWHIPKVKEGKDVNGDVPAGGKNGVGTW